jgi:hypothetical protein
MRETIKPCGALSRRAFLTRSSVAAAGAAVAGWTAGQACLTAAAHELVYAKDGSGVFGYKDTPKQPWSKWLVHDPDRPAPKFVRPGEPSTQDKAGTAPGDAIVLFDGRDLSQWHPSDWKGENGYAEAIGRPMVTKREFGDCQLHVEWQAPDPPRGDQMNRGNNGVLLMGLFEVQIFDSFNTKIYADGQAASIYGQTAPLVNACLKPGMWQTFDIIFLAPRFEGQKLVRPARTTVLHNGLLVHHDQEVYGTTMHAALPAYQPGVTKGPLVLGAHNNPVRFRNMWIRPLEGV